MIKSEDQQKKASLCFTIDVEDWFHILESPAVPNIKHWTSLESRVERNLEKLLVLLDSVSASCTLFWLGWVAERHKKLVRKCQKAGHEIACHGYGHVMPNQVGERAFREDIHQSKAILEDITGEPVRGYRAPGFGLTSETAWVFDVIKEVGYQYDSSVFPASRDHGGLSDALLGPHFIETRNGHLLEIPLSVVEIFNRRVCLFGGGYLRLAAKPMIKWGLDRLKTTGQPLVVYIHPREIDPSHPRLPLCLKRRFKCYVGLKSTMSKIEWLCRDYEPCSLLNAIENCIRLCYHQSRILPVVNLKDGHMATVAKFAEEEMAHSGRQSLRDRILQVERTMATLGCHEAISHGGSAIPNNSPLIIHNDPNNTSRIIDGRSDKVGQSIHGVDSGEFFYRGGLAVAYEDTTTIESTEDMQTVVVQGLGFVGAAMAIATANAVDENDKPFFNVIGVDLKTKLGKERVNKINSGCFPFETVDRTITVGARSAVDRGNLTATCDDDVIGEADVVLVSVNMDISLMNGTTATVNFDPFKSAIQTLGKKIKAGALIIIETTVPPGTCERIVKPIIRELLKERGINPESIYIAHSYERVMPGANYLDSIINYWRVYAGMTVQAADLCEAFLSKIINVEKYPLTRLKTTIASETSKVLENSYRAVNIAFIEEWGRFAEEVGFDLYEVIDAVRVRPTHSNIRQPGFGVGGYCLTKDPLFAKFAAREIFALKGHDFPFSSQAIEVNRVMPLVTLEKLKVYFNGSISGKRILLMGVSYREDVGDTRSSPAAEFFIRAHQEGARVYPHDPLVEYWEEMQLHISRDLPDPESFDAIVFSVPHHDYRKIDFSQWLKTHNGECLIFDANNVLTSSQRSTVKEMGNSLLSIGRG